MGAASAHEGSKFDEHDDESASGPAGENDPTHPSEGTRGELHNVDFVGYHALADTEEPAKGAGENAQERFGDNPRDYQQEYGAEAMDPHYGGVTEIRTHGDYAYVTYFSAEDPTPSRGMAIVDISEYNAAESEAEIEDAELNVVGYLRKNNVQAAAMDVKISDDGQYAFISTQPYTFLFGGITGNTDDPTHAEGLIPQPNPGDSGFTYNPSGIVAVDISDKENPQTVDSFALEGSGSHNAFHHRINGEDYIFAINDSGNLAGTGSGMFVIQFDRGSGRLELVNRWYLETNLAQGEVTTEGAGGEPYIHDMELQNDPKTGTPVCYLAYWGRGMWALDVSDPENIEPLGNFDMAACHFASPAPTTIETPNGEKRVAVASQEISENDDHTGRVYLVDCDGLFESEDRYYEVPRTQDGIALLGELAMWEWHAEWETPGEDSIDFGPYDFSLSPHNSDFAMDADGNFWIHQSHYSGGVRFLRVETGDGHGLVSPAERFECTRPSDTEGNCEGHQYAGTNGPHNTASGWDLVEEGWARPNLEPPTESRMEGLNYLTPFCWGANESNGVTFAADINQGIYALRQTGDSDTGARGIPLGDPPVVASVERTDDSSVFTAGQVNKVTVEVTDLQYHDEVHVRDRIPDGWEVIAGDSTETVEAGGDTYVDLGTLSAGESATYIVEVGDSTGSYQGGPTQASADAERWTTVPNTTDTSYVVGVSTNLALGGVAVGTAGALSGKSESVRERVRDALSGED